MKQLCLTRPKCHIGELRQVEGWRHKDGALVLRIEKHEPRLSGCDNTIYWKLTDEDRRQLREFLAEEE